MGMQRLLMGTILALVGGLGSPASGALRDADLRSEIEAFALGYAGTPPFAMVIPSLRDFTGPSEAFDRVQVDLSTSAKGPVRGSLPVTVRLRSEGEEFKRGIVTVRLRADHVALVAARPLSAGDVLTRADLREASVSEHQVARGGSPDAAGLVGRRVTRNVRTGTVLRSSLVEDTPVIERGSTVRIRFKSGSLQIEGVGRAREAGVPGQPIRVLNLESRREIVGIAQQDGMVHVDY